MKKNIYLFVVICFVFSSTFQLFNSKISAVELSTEPLKLQEGVIEEVTSNWKTIFLDEAVQDAVVITTPIFSQSNTSAVTVVRNITENSFDIKAIFGTDGIDNEPISASFIAIKEGVYSLGTHGIKLEARKVESLSVSNKWDSWTGDKTEYLNQYSKPVVFGQVISSTESPKYQTFFSRGKNIKYAPTRTHLFVGRHTGESNNRDLESATLGLIIIEEGSYVLENKTAKVFLSGRSVEGINRQNLINIDKEEIESSVLSISGIRGGDGGFPVLVGENIEDILVNKQLKVAIGEDKFSDSEISHTKEQISVLALSNQLDQPKIAGEPLLVFDNEGGYVQINAGVGETIHYTLDGSLPTLDSPVYTEPLFVESDVKIKAIAHKTGFKYSLPSDIEIFIIDHQSENLTKKYIVSDLHWPNTSRSTFDFVPDLSNALIEKISIKEGNLNENIGRYSIKQIQGLILIPKSDTYKFYLSKKHSTATDFFINDMDSPLISKAVVSQSSSTASVYLEKGFYQFKLNGLNNYWGGYVGLEWSSPIISRGKIPSSYFFHKESSYQETLSNLDTDGDGLTDKDEINVYFTNPRSKDTDGDGLKDFVEIHDHGTDPLSRDSDNDGVSDFLEAVVFKSLSNDSLGEISEVSSRNGVDYISSKGRWDNQDDLTVVSTRYRGELTYQFNTEKDDMYLLDILAGASEDKYLKREYALEVYVDGEFVGENRLKSSYGYKDDHFGFQFLGGLNIPEGGEYTFSLNSDAGSQLFINNELIVDHDGVHEVSELSGSITLSEGIHNIKVWYFDTDGDHHLSVSFSGNGFESREIASHDLTGPIQWKYYEGSWESCPEFNYLSPIKTGYSNSFDLELRKTLYPGQASYLLPWLKAGPHEVKVRWANGNYNKNLRVEKLSLSEVSGDDLDNNGVKDWIDNKLSIECGLDDIISSKTSPICIEGKAKYLNLMTISPSAQINKSAGEAWYSNIDLNADSPIELNISFQNDIKTESTSIYWERTYLPSVQEVITIRKGDSLLLDPNEENLDFDGSIYIGEQVFNIKEGEALSYLFDEEGEYEVSSFYVDESGNTQSTTIQVIAIGLDLPNKTFAGIVGNERRISFSEYFKNGVSYDVDTRLNSWYTTDNGDVAFSLDSNKERTVLARLGENGPILDSLNLRGIKAYGATQTWFHTVNPLLEDGSILMKMGVIGDSLFDNVEFHVDIFLPGIYINDGSRKAIFKKEDLNDIQEGELTLIKTESARKTAACHHINIYQDGEFVGRAY